MITVTCATCHTAHTAHIIPALRWKLGHACQPTRPAEASAYQPRAALSWATSHTDHTTRKDNHHV